MRTILAVLLIWTMAGATAGQCLAPSNASSHYLDENTTLCPGTYYFVHLNINRSYVEFDCAGAELIGLNNTNAGTAVDIWGVAYGTTVKNCVIRDYEKAYKSSAAIPLGGLVYDYFSNNTVSGCLEAGIDVEHFDDNVLDLHNVIFHLDVLFYVIDDDVFYDDIH